MPDPTLKEKIAADLDEARRRTHSLLAPLDDGQLMTQHDDLMSPPVWDYCHIGVFEELWLVQQLSGAPPLDEQLMHVYNAMENPRPTRRRLPLLDRSRTVEYLGEVRQRALELLGEVELDGREPLFDRAYVYDLVIQHEHQHNETILQTVQLTPGQYLKELPPRPSAPATTAEMVSVPGGLYRIGSDGHEPYDNEHPCHEVELAPYRIDRYPVTNAAFAAFIEDEGYRRKELWSPDGWEWRETFGIEAPEYWYQVEGEWHLRRYGVALPVPPAEPVMHVSYFEAEAYASWQGKRLPNEFEWEVAAAWDPTAQRARRYPWGDQPAGRDHANLDQVMFGPVPVGTFSAGASPIGCEQMLGDVWEWTSSYFQPYPGFRAYPYPEYSEPFFGERFRVLRGGSWATRPRVARNTFRNWDSPLKRQIFAGMRCAADA